MDAAGQLQWSRRAAVIDEEKNRDGWYLLHTNQPIGECPQEKVLSQYIGLLEVEDAFRELKTYLKRAPSITTVRTVSSIASGSVFWLPG